LMDGDVRVEEESGGGGGEVNIDGGKQNMA
jgi:hypothetical protein